MHTEEEMREIRCCGPEGCGVIRPVDEHGNVDKKEESKLRPPNQLWQGYPAVARFCIASKCAAWRWDRDQQIAEYDPERGRDPKSRGYCGLAS